MFLHELDAPWIQNNDLNWQLEWETSSRFHHFRTMYFPIKFHSRKKSKSTRCFSFKYDSGEPVAAIRNDDFLNRPFNLQHKTMLAVLRNITQCKIHYILQCQLTQYCTVRCLRPLLKPISIEKLSKVAHQKVLRKFFFYATLFGVVFTFLCLSHSV